ncbi:unnamed protein product [Nezara viridula]|uniref:Uncharacterized protein n=1 Tax=Nezara viridula TaxID=85310 RepID=A0A9P0GUV9_NEZVI|nr:unnamed protein product [Nezara viridula]
MYAANKSRRKVSSIRKSFALKQV